MTKEPNTEPSHGPGDESQFAAFLRKVGDLMEARKAANPTPEPPPEPCVEKPGSLIAAEKDVLCCQLLERLQLPLCGGPEKCKRGRCRRARRCSELESVNRMTEAARATLAREQAKWQPPAMPQVRERRRSRRASGNTSPREGG